MTILNRRLLRILTCASFYFLPLAAARADDVELLLQVTSGERHAQTMFTEREPSLEKTHPQPVFHASHGESLKIVWQARHDNGKSTFKDVLVHVFVAPEEKVGQTARPNLGKDVPHECAITVDFKPDTEVHGDFTLRLARPGSYMLRIETRGLVSGAEHEDYTVIDLVIE